MLTPAETINREPHGLLERTRLHFDGALNSGRKPAIADAAYSASVALAGSPLTQDQ